jgi:hypothetical protein
MDYIRGSWMTGQRNSSRVVLRPSAGQTPADASFPAAGSRAGLLAQAVAALAYGYLGITPLSIAYVVRSSKLLDFLLR